MKPTPTDIPQQRGTLTFVSIEGPEVGTSPSHRIVTARCSGKLCAGGTWTYKLSEWRRKLSDATCRVCAHAASKRTHSRVVKPRPRVIVPFGERGTL